MTKEEKLQTEVITTEQAIYCMNHQYNYEKYECDDCPYCDVCEEKGIEGRMIKRAVIALKIIRDLPSVAPQESCDDCVSRKAVLNTLFYKSDNNCEVVLNKELQDRVKALPSVTPTHEWIPCSDRLPEEKVEVLVTTECGNITIAERYSANDYFINDGAATADEDEITAWMPLPLPWKGE